MCCPSALLRTVSARAKARTLKHAQRTLITMLQDRSKPSPARDAKTLSNMTRTKKKKHPAKYWSR